MRRATLLVAAALALAGCGDSGDSGDSGDGSAAAPSPAPTREPAETAAPSSGTAPAQPGGSSDFDPRALYERESPGVVTVRALFGGGVSSILGGGQGGGVGSGFVLNADGEIVTNAHVVTQGEGTQIRRAREVFVEFADGNQVEAKVAGHDPFADIALLRVDPKGLELRPLELGTDESIEIGEPVVAIGSPFGQQQSLSVGVVSARDRSIRSLTNFQINGAVQTDAAINPGNSGGPLVDADGKVIGVNQQIQTQSGGNEGVGFAVSVDVVRRSVEQLDAEGRVRYAYLGISSQALYPQLVEEFDLPVEEGAWIQTVSPGGPADRAGLRGGSREQRFQTTPVRVGGDIITRVGDRGVTDPDSLALAIADLRPGQTVKVVVQRDGRERTVDVRLGERPVRDPESRP